MPALTSIAIISSSAIHVDRNFIGNSDRAGLSNFGGAASLLDNTISCSAFPVEGEPVGNVPFQFTGLDGNPCGCGDPLGTCVAVSAGLEPPTAPPAP